MRLYEEIFENNDMAASRCVIMPSGGGYFEGVKSVGDFSSEKIEICFARKIAIVEGIDLSIKKYCDGDLQLSGKICSLRFEGETFGKNREE